jgi:hypothetical protein
MQRLDERFDHVRRAAVKSVAPAQIKIARRDDFALHENLFRIVLRPSSISAVRARAFLRGFRGVGN